MSLKFGVHDVIVLFLFATMGFHIARLGFFGPQRSCYKGSLLYVDIKSSKSGNDEHFCFV